MSDRAREERRLGWKLAGPAFVIMVLVTFYPILQAVYSSLFKHRLTDPGAQKFVFLENYLIILRDPLWWQAFGTTAFITVVTVVVELVLGFLIALAMAKIIYGRGLLRTIVLIPYSIITVVSAFSWFYAFATDTGFVDPLLHTLSFGVFPEKFDWFGGFWTSMVPICVSEIWKTTPFMSLLLLAGLTQIDSAMEEAAIVDGATWGERMRRVVLPNMKSAIMVALLFRTLDAFRIFDNIFIMTAGSHDTASLSLVAYNQTISRTEVGLGSAVSVLLFLCVVIIAVIFVKGFRVDLARGRR
ncbi:carbohydrate ABC transporter permease [[Pseudopropionibacterium] massiliense]|uniref:carbohydrate ABC transporter permease n=1 Tax=[Pseudopropionibacterium] massiliense TaxID=2220000 RepID=UPI001A91A112|nr:sugar ABC transporter permease [[Pseudopropionibacterium] massiliense]